jgi:hypothetical protein
VCKHLFEHAIREGLSEGKKDHVRYYLKAAGNYSYDAANVKRTQRSGVCLTRSREEALSRYERFILSHESLVKQLVVVQPAMHYCWLCRRRHRRCHRPCSPVPSFPCF